MGWTFFVATQLCKLKVILRSHAMNWVVFELLIVTLVRLRSNKYCHGYIFYRTVHLARCHAAASAFGSTRGGGVETCDDYSIGFTK